jgi:hypothetical protein
MTHHLVIATDSRGRQLENYIKRHDPFPPTFSLSFIIKPGATIAALKKEICLQISSLESDNFISVNVVLAAGICDLTEKINHHPGLEISYTNNTNKADKIITELQSMYTDLKSSYNAVTSSNNTTSFFTEIFCIQPI